MTWLLKFIRYSLLALILLCVLIVFFGIGDEADVELNWQLAPQDLVRAKKILHEGSKIRPEDIQTIELSREDLILAANYLLNRYSKSAVQISLKPNQLKFTATTTLPPNRIGKYLNITLALGNVGGNQLPTITKFKAGKLLLPSALAGWVIEFYIRHSALNNYFILATRPIKSVLITPEKISISYSPTLDTLIQAQQLLANNNTHAAQLYQTQLNAIVERHDKKWRLSLAELLQPLFKLAYERSTLESAIEENRIVIFTVNNYVNQHAKKFLQHPLNLSNQKYYSAFVYQRGDLAQHFMASAALTASVNGQLSTAMGEEKELRDAAKGSGFSFIDLAADKAGTRFGEAATVSPESAQRLQKVMSEIKDYSAFIPDPRDLPEHMNEAEFKQRFGSTNSPQYQHVLQMIDERINQLVIYQE